MPVLHTGGHHQMFDAVKSLKVELGAQCNLGDGKRHFGDEIVFFAMPAFVGSNTKMHVEIARVSPARADGTTAGQSQDLPRVDTSRNFHRERHLLQHSTLTSTPATW